MAIKSETIDIEKTKKIAEHVFEVLGGALVSAMIYLGDRMGLYQSLNGAGALTSDELAQRTGLHERWIREWLYGQAAANLIDYKGEGRFELSPESALVLANENSPFFLAGGFCALPQQMAVLNLLPESFKSGKGLTYDQLGPEVNRGVERLLAPWFRTQLVPSALPKLDGVVAKLQTGAKVADIGCGAGVALIEMAKAFPRSNFHGYDIAKIALTHAAENSKRAGVTNITFYNASVDPLPGDASHDFITTFDCLHDMTRPDLVMKAIRSAIETANAVLDGVSRRQHQDGHSPPGFSQSAAHFEPVRSRNHDVQNDQVILIDVRLIQRFFAGHCGIDRVGLLAQSLDHKPAHPRIIFDQQNPHGCIIRESAAQSAVLAVLPARETCL